MKESLDRKYNLRKTERKQEKKSKHPTLGDWPNQRSEELLHQRLQLEKLSVVGNIDIS